MKIGPNTIMILIALAFVGWYCYSFYIMPSYFTALHSGTVMTDNWWAALNWIRNNTKECAVVATYWDPGHFITAVAKRPVVFDGATQGGQRTIIVTGDLNETETRNIAIIPNYRVEKTNTQTKITTARIQDIATTLFTDDEEKAVKILKKYLQPNCTEMYYIASADLVLKSQWWTYFATWDPTYRGNCPMLKEPHGDCYFYNIIRLSGVKNLGNNTTAFEYAFGPGQKFIFYQVNNSVVVVLQQRNTFVPVKRVIFFTDIGMHVINQTDYKVNGTLFVTPDYTVVYYIPKELENSLFTRMYFFNGMGLKSFKFVKSWGGEVKLFKLEFS